MIEYTPERRKERQDVAIGHAALFMQRLVRHGFHFGGRERFPQEVMDSCFFEGDLLHPVPGWPESDHDCATAALLDLAGQHADRFPISEIQQDQFRVLHGQGPDHLPGGEILGRTPKNNVENAAFGDNLVDALGRVGIRGQDGDVQHGRSPWAGI
jgi:hypothetical protein